MNLQITNKNGQTLDLFNNRDKFVLIGVESLHGLETSIGESESPYIDGSTIDNVKALPRGIELTFKIVDDVNENLNFIKSYIKSKQVVTLIEDEKEIKGVATLNYYTRMLQSCELKVSIYCGQPYWEDIEAVVGAIAIAINLLYFPQEGQHFTEMGRPFGVLDTSLQKTFINDGDVSVGMIIKITALADVENPKISCSTGTQNGWFMQLNLTLNSADEVEICTTKGNKYIAINGSQYKDGNPILNSLVFVGDDWLQLEEGANTFNISALSGESYMYFTISYRQRYE